MENYFNENSFCFGCMERQQGLVCPECGFDSRTVQEEGFLPFGTMLSGKYITGRILDINSDGVSYIGFDTMQNERVIIREYFPCGMSFRDIDGLTVQMTDGYDMSYIACLSEFKRLWRDLARLKNLTCLFAVYDIFDENGTAYAVSEYRDFITLDRYLDNRKGEPMQWQEIRAKFMPVLSTLEMLHSAGMIHGGISPETLVLCDDKRVRLYGFSIRDVRMTGGSLQPELFPGYAAMEQYDVDGQPGTYTDIYAFAAVLYRALTGHTPPQVQARVNNDRLIVSNTVAQSTPQCVLKALGNAMQIYPEQRTPDAEQFRAQISAAPSVTVAEQMQRDAEAQQYSRPARTVQPQPQPQRRPSNATLHSPRRSANAGGLNATVMALIITLAIGAVICVATAVLMRKPAQDVPEVTTTEATTLGKISVPNLVSKDYYLDILSDEEKRKSFTFVVEEQFNELPEGTVIEQEPLAGMMVEPGTEIKLTVSKGAEMIELPSVSSSKKKEAVEMLEELGFVCDVVEKYNSNGNTEGYVAGTDLKYGEKYPKGTQVIVFVWGPAPTQSSGME